MVKISAHLTDEELALSKKLKDFFKLSSHAKLYVKGMALLEEVMYEPNKYEKIEGDEQALLWRNIVSIQRRIDNYHIESPRDQEVVTKMTTELRHLINEYHKKSYIQIKEIRKGMQDLLEHLKAEKNQIEIEKRRIEYDEKSRLIATTERPEPL
jgi:hypothetical protein